LPDPGGRERFIWGGNLLLLVTMTLCIASGILISEAALPELGFTSPASSFWRQMHSTTATLTLILVPIHVALRWMPQRAGLVQSIPPARLWVY
jgi:hypothetical protein